MQSSTMKPRLVISRARTLIHESGSLFAAHPVVLVHPERVLQLRTSLATLSFGPLAALRIPAGVQAWCDDVPAVGQALALWLVDPGAPFRSPRQELSPVRLPIALEEFGAVLRLWRGAREGAAVDGTVRWLRREAAQRLKARNGHRPSVDAWRKWSPVAASAETALWEAKGARPALARVLETLDSPARRAVARLLGTSLRQAAAEFRRRDLLSACAGRGDDEGAALHAAGYSGLTECHVDFEAACGESAAVWLARHELTRVAHDSSR